MALSNELISQFVKATQDKEETKKESTAYGKIVKQGDVEYVQLDGSDLLTPISSTTVVKDGDRVIVTIKDHTAIVTGDLTTPSASNNDVKEIGNKISEFEIIIADKVTTEQLEAEIAKIDKLIADNIEAVNGKFETIEGKVADIDQIKADVIEVEGKITAHEGEFTTLRADIADFKNVTTESIEAIEGEFRTIESDYADFKETTTNKLTANEAAIGELETKKLDTETATITYANIDFSNIKEAAIEKLFSDSGIIKDLIMSEGKVTGELVGVTIKGDLIEGNTVKADKLVILGEDGLYYKLNVDALGETTASSDEKYQNGLDGSVIIAESVTAEKIAVDDLVAFGATIGGYHITDHALYSGVKNSATNTTRGVFLGDDGQVAFGDANNYLKFFEDENGTYKLEISANAIKFGVKGTSIEDAIKDAMAYAEDGENLVLNSDVKYTTSNKLINNYALSSYLEEGETYTASLCVDPNEEQTDSDMYTTFSLSLSNEHALQCTMNSNEQEKYIISKTFIASYAPGMTPDVKTEYGELQLSQTISRKECLDAPFEIYLDANTEYTMSVDLEPGIYMITHPGALDLNYDNPMNNGYVNMLFIDNDIEEYYLESGYWIKLDKKETTVKFTFNIDNYDDVTSCVIRNVGLYKVTDNNNYLDPFFQEEIQLYTGNNEIIIPVDIEPGLYIFENHSYDYHISMKYDFLDNNIEYVRMGDVTQIFKRETQLKITLQTQYETNFTVDNPYRLTDLRLYKVTDDGINYLDSFPRKCEIEVGTYGFQFLQAGFYKFTCSGIDISEESSYDIDDLTIMFSFQSNFSVMINKYNLDGFTCYFELPYASTQLMICSYSKSTNDFMPLKYTVKDMTLTRTTDINRAAVLDHIVLPVNDKYYGDSAIYDQGSTIYLSWKNIDMPDDGSIEIVAYRMPDRIANRITIDKSIADTKECELLLKNDYMYYYEIINHSDDIVTIDGLKMRLINDLEVTKPDEGITSIPAFNNTIRWIKVEKGDTATAWSPAPDDIYNNMATDADLSKLEETVNNRVNEAQATIELLQGLIANLVTDANGGSLMTQTPDGWTFNMGNITSNLEAIQNAMEDTNTRQQETNDELQKLTDLVSDVVARTAYVTIATDDNGDPCIELGRSDNLFKVRITNTAIDFLEGSTKIAYANNNTFYSSKLITKAIQIGEGPGFIWQTRASGNMGLIYISE